MTLAMPGVCSAGLAIAALPAASAAATCRPVPMPPAASTGVGATASITSAGAISTTGSATLATTGLLTLSANAGAASRAVLYEGPNLSGRSFVVENFVPNLDGTGFNDHSLSLRIEPGERVGELLLPVGAQVGLDRVAVAGLHEVPLVAVDRDHRVDLVGRQGRPAHEDRGRDRAIRMPRQERQDVPGRAAGAVDVGPLDAARIEDRGQVV